jgi:sialic acid synthase SpsE
MVGPGHPAVIIAEVGINHEGDLDVCIKMIEAAAAVGADAVKLQTSDPDENYKPGTESYEIYKRSFLAPDETAKAFAAARAAGVEPFTTTGASTFEWIERLQPVAYKISSSTLGHFPLVRMAARTGRPVVLSTGMAENADVEASITWARQNGARDLVVMQCTSLYPCPPEKLDIAAIGDLAKRNACFGGFSDHSLGEDAAPLAVAAGAHIIEKHFTLDTGRKSFDHALSLDPRGFRSMVEKVRRAEAMLGSAAKRLVPEARAVAVRMKRYLVARVPLPAGRVLVPADLGVMRLNEPTNGLVPKNYDSIIGARLRRPVAQWAALVADDIEVQGRGGSR